MVEPLVIVGASARAAAFSALRAGLRPWCADLFADLDLRAACPVIPIPPDEYPDAFERIVRDAPPGPILYTGALENRPRLVAQLARGRPLWGNTPGVLRAARDPMRLATTVPGPAVRLSLADLTPDRRWLVKPRRGAGGRGIRFADSQRPASRPEEVYYQEYIKGLSCAAVYVALDGRAELLGVTWQLVGEPWLHAAGFHYCGSVGPLSLTAAERGAFTALGDALAGGLGLRGLFGVDCVLRDGIPYPVEINPRYTASIEVLEYATGLRALAWHRRAFDRDAPAPAPPAAANAIIGKAIYYAPQDLVIPERPPWGASEPTAFKELPAFADLPPAGQPIAAGRPVVTAFVRGMTIEEVMERLQEAGADLDRSLMGR